MIRPAMRRAILVSLFLAMTAVLVNVFVLQLGEWRAGRLDLINRAYGGDFAPTGGERIKGNHMQAYVLFAFLVSGPFLFFVWSNNRKAKANVKLTKRLSNLSIVEWIDNAIIEGRLHNDPWVSRYWMPLTQHQKQVWFADKRQQ